MKKPCAEMIDPRDAGVRRLNISAPVFGADALARAEDELGAMDGQMAAWLEAIIERLQQARLTADASSWDEISAEAVHSAAHDLKGIGETCGFPLSTQIAASLCRLIETDAGKAAAQKDPALACAHIDALRAVVRDNVTTEADPIGRTLLRALESRVATLGVAPR
jgi:HPt (histidine-containing phosphotransfer) domain-containing protein